MSFSRLNIADGDFGEKLWAEHLTSLGRNCTISDNRRATDWDVSTDDGVKYEVKYDKLAYRTGNFYLEFWNTHSKKPSGVMSCQVDYFIYIVRDTDNSRHLAYCFRLTELQEHLQSSNYKVRENKRRGDSNAKGWTPRITDLCESPDSGFIKLIEL